MYFSIGGHPAFCCPIAAGENQEDYKIWLDAKEQVTASVIANGLVTEEKEVYTLEDGCLQITEHLFDKDALVIENNQVQKVALVRPDGSHYLTVCFDAPLFGIWSPPGKKRRLSASNLGTADVTRQILMESGRNVSGDKSFLPENVLRRLTILQYYQKWTKYFKIIGLCIYADGRHSNYSGSCFRSVGYRGRSICGN